MANTATQPRPAASEPDRAQGSGKQPPSINPYLAARREYDSRYGDQARQRARWQAIAFLLAVVVLAFSFQLMRMAGQSRIQPYVIEVDRQGEILQVGPAERMSAPSERLLASELARFVISMRSVSSDPLTQRQLVGAGYRYVDQRTAEFLNQYFSAPENNPLLLGRQFARMVDVRSILPVPESQAWKVEWSETVLPVSHGSPSVANWEGYLTVRLSPPRTAEEVVANPLGLYVTDITWTRITEPREIRVDRPGTSRGAPRS